MVSVNKSDSDSLLEFFKFFFTFFDIFGILLKISKSMFLVTKELNLSQNDQKSHPQEEETKPLYKT